ncbi:MAG: hypothetical protein QXJ28_02940 [Candidatus Pacearchaeota archaeon]
MRIINLVKNNIAETYILYDGPISDGLNFKNPLRRKEYSNLDSLLEGISKDLNINPKRPIKLNFSGYCNDEKEYILRELSKKFKKIQYT